MNKLEFKHLAPYLPYGLQVLTGDGIGKVIGVPDILTNGDVVKVHFGVNLKRKKFDFGFGGSEYNKPTNFGYYYINKVILQNIFDENDVLDFSDSRAIPMFRPLSDLTKPCLPGGKIPILELAKIVFDKRDNPNEFLFQSLKENTVFIAFPDKRNVFGYDSNTKSFFSSSSGLAASVVNQLALFEWLYEHHFDVKNLIGHNLAIDINTIDI